MVQPICSIVMNNRLSAYCSRQFVLLILGLLLHGLAFPVAAEEGARLWLLLSEGAGAYVETSQATLAALPRNLDRQVIVYTSNDEAWAREIRPGDLVVPLGLKATKAAIQLDQSVHVLAALLPRQAYDSLASNAASTAGKRSFSALVLDQPFDRQMALIRLILPKADQVGVILGKPTMGFKGDLSKAASHIGLKLNAEVVENQTDLFASQRNLLKDNDALLALPDSSVLNQTTLISYLITAYRARVPVMGFSQSLSEAGALASVYTAPEQIGRQLAELIVEATNAKPFRSGKLIYPRYFKVYVNRQVARSLELDVASDNWLQQQLVAKTGVTQ